MDAPDSDNFNSHTWNGMADPVSSGETLTRSHSPLHISYIIDHGQNQVSQILFNFYIFDPLITHILLYTMLLSNKVIILLNIELPALF